MTTPAIVSTAILVGAAISAAYGAYRGSIRQIGSVAAFLFGFLGARLFGPDVSRLLDLPPMLCYAIVFSLVFMAVIVLARVLRFTVKMLLLGPVDRLLGALIGAAKWLLGVSMILNLYLLCNPPVEPLSAAPTQWTVRLLPRLFGLAQSYFN